MKQHRYK